MINEALSYLKGEGYRQPLSIMPLKGKIPLTAHGCKDASQDPAQVREWWTQYPSANVGIVTGDQNQILVVDVDIKHSQGKYGDQSLQALEKELGALPETWEAVTGTGGRHLYFRYPKGHDIRNSASQLGKDVDIRAQGGYVVAPPSVHPDTHKLYEWKRDPAHYRIADLPEKWLRRLEKKPEKIKGLTVFTVPETVQKGIRNDSLFRYGASLRAKALPAIQTWDLMRDFNSQKCSPPVAEAELKRIYDSVMRYPAGAPEAEIMKSCNQESMNSGELDLSQFHHFDKGGAPSSVYDFRIYEYLRSQGDLFIMGGIPYHYSQGVYRADMSGAQLKTAIRRLIYPQLIRSSTIDRVYKLFLGEAELQVKPEELNQYPAHWINFRNGFYDPIQKRLIPHDPEYRAVNQIPWEYHPEDQLTGSEVEKWLSFIVPDPADRLMLLEFSGLCMTRDTRQQKFLILNGAGGSGKSTLIKLLELMIGADNISNISLKELTQRFASYGLMGKLLNSCADLETSALEDVSTLKKILGEDSLRGEAKGKDAISFKSYAKLIFSTNELPLVINEKTNGFFRRLLILSMDRQPDQKRADYLDILQTELPYFIQLSVRALEGMYKRGLITESSSSAEAVRTLRCDSDTVEAWIADRCIRETGARSDRGALFQSYDNYCLTADRTPLSRNNFYRSLRQKNFREVMSCGYRYFEGLKLH